MGLDCTIPLQPQFAREHFDRSTAFVLGDPPPDVVVMSEDELKTVYRAFSNLRPRLGRCNDAPWYRYTFSDSDFAVEAPHPELSNFDPRHGV